MKKLRPFVAATLVLTLCLSLLPTGTALAAEAEAPVLTNREMVALLPSERPEVIKPETAYQWGYGEEYSSRYWTPEKSVEDVFREISSQAERLTSGSKTETEKAYAIYDWVAKNISYDYVAYEYGWNTHDRDLTPEESARVFQAVDSFYTFYYRRGVCEGQAFLVCLMLTLAGLPAANIVGNMRIGDEGHAWNGVYADGRWILLDATNNQWELDADAYEYISGIGYQTGFWEIGLYNNGSVTCALRANYDYPVDLAIPDGVTLIPGYFFSGISSDSDDGGHPYADVASVVIPDSVTSIKRHAFYGCTGLTSVTIPSSVTSIGEGAFYGCTSLTSLTIPSGVTSIGNYTFYGCTSLTGVTIPSSVTSIGREAFNGCTSLTSLTIPSSVTSIGDYAFVGCDSLANVTIESSETRIGKDAFKGTPWLNPEIVIEDGVLTAYQGDGGDVVIPDGVTSIGDRAFFRCANLTSLTIPASVISIGEDAFYDCTGLTGVTIPSSVTSIGEGAFSACRSLTSVTIPDSVTSIGRAAFIDCDSLTSVTIGNGVTSIGDSAFYGCGSLTGVTIPSSVTSIGNNAFSGCTGLTGVTIPRGVTSIGNFVFFGCTGLTSVSIPDSVTSIGVGMFYGCDDLTDIYYGGSEAQWAALEVEDGSSDFTRITIHYNSPMTEAPAGSTIPTVEDIPASGTAVETKQTIMLDGTAKEFQCYAIMDANGNGTNYIKIRDLADALNGTGAQFNVGWDGKISIQSNTAYQSNGSENTITYTGNQAYESISSIAISFNGQDINLTAINIQGGNTYYKLRDLGQLLNFNVKWDTEAGQVAIESNQPYNPND